MDQVSPTLYRFKLREGVKFHDGAPFTADDAVFSIHRAMAPTSNYKAYTTGIKEARKIDDHTIEIETSAPNPVLLRQLPNVFIMNKAWSEAQRRQAAGLRQQGRNLCGAQHQRAPAPTS